MRLNSPIFQGSRLREAREARALTQVALADLLGVSAPSVSQYESGAQVPSPQAMSRICTVLNLPPQFFTTPRAPRREVSLFWRSQSAATKRARDAHERKYVWFRDVVDFLADYIEFPASNVPDFTPPDDPSALSDDDVEDLAARTRRHWNLGDGPISNLVWLIENNGGIVVRGELGETSLDAFSDFDAGDSWRCYVFLGADKESAARSRFDAAHELGHAVLHRNVPGRVRRRSETLKLIEAQANRFAGTFMLPAETFPTEVYSPSLESLLQLKPRWRMSVGAMAKRLRNLSVIGEDRYRQLRIQMSRKGWTRREPLDDTLEPEEPRLLRRSIDLLLDNNVLSREELERRTLVSAAVIEKLMGLPPGYLDEPPPPLSLPLRMG